MGALATIKHTLTAAVANAGTVVVPYPAGFVQADLENVTDYAVAVNANDVFKNGAGVLLAFGAADITVTNQSGISWPIGSALIITVGRTDRNGSYNLTLGEAYNQAAAGDGSNPNYTPAA